MLLPYKCEKQRLCRADPSADHRVQPRGAWRKAPCNTWSKLPSKLLGGSAALAGRDLVEGGGGAVSVNFGIPFSAQYIATAREGHEHPPPTFGAPTLVWHLGISPHWP